MRISDWSSDVCSSDLTSVMMVRKDSPAKTVDELYEVPTNVSCSGHTTSSAQSGAVLKYFTGVKFNMVCGYDSSTASILAVFRGEADLTSTVWTTWKRSEEHTSELQSLMRISYAVFCLKKKKKNKNK